MKTFLAFFIFFLYFILISPQNQNPLIIKNESDSFKFAFGSCNKFVWDDDSFIFKSIKNYQPDVYIWLGS